MPASRAVRHDIHRHGLDPMVHHSQLDKTQRLAPAIVQVDQPEQESSTSIPTSTKAVVDVAPATVDVTPVDVGGQDVPVVTDPVIEHVEAQADDVSETAVDDASTTTTVDNVAKSTKKKEKVPKPAAGSAS